MFLRAVAVMVLLMAGASGAIATDIKAGEAVFRKCSACHNIRNTGNRMGPHLMGIVGRQVGSVADFRFYSQAMLEAGAEGRVWTEELLADFISSPKKAIPGNSMRFFGLWSDEDIANLIAYFKTVPMPSASSTLNK